MNLLFKLIEWILGIILVGSIAVVSTRLREDLGDKEPVVIMAIILISLYAIIYFAGLYMFRKTQQKWYRITSLVMGTIYLAFIIGIIISQ